MTWRSHQINMFGAQEISFAFVQRIRNENTAQNSKTAKIVHLFEQIGVGKMIGMSVSDNSQTDVFRT